MEIFRNGSADLAPLDVGKVTEKVVRSRLHSFQIQIMKPLPQFANSLTEAGCVNW